MRRKNRIIIPAILVIFLLITALLVTSVQAATGDIVVNTASWETHLDDGYCSLYEAIIAANTDATFGVVEGECAAGSGADTIVFADNYTISVDYHRFTSLPEITTDMTITGNGRTNTIIQSYLCDPTVATCVNNTQIFVITGGIVEFNDLTVRYGAGASGSAFAISNADVTINNSLINRNNTLGQNVGGGILAQNSTLVINNSTVSENVAGSNGGGIYQFNTDLTITNSVISDNQGADFGGGVWQYGGSLTITNSTFSGNEAYSYGGGIYNSSGTVTVQDNSVFDDNEVTHGDGGAIYSRDTAVEIKEGSLIGGVGNGNIASGNGGGIYAEGSSFTIDNSTISENEASGSGAGIYTANGSLDVKNGSLIDGNILTGDGSGGGILFIGEEADEYLTISHSTISNNKIFGSAYGAGIHGSEEGDSDGVITIEYSTISGNINDSNDGGGVSTFYPTLIIKNSAIINNSARKDGGVGSWDSPTTISNTTISGNTATVGDAGGLGIEGANLVELYNVTIANNTSPDAGGIDFQASSGTNIYIHNSIIAGNTGGNGNDCYGGSSGTYDFRDFPSFIQDDTNCSGLFSNNGNVIIGDPLLGPLSENGGPTKTHALLDGSLAIDAADDSICGISPVSDEDQRGVERGFEGNGTPDNPETGDCDIGAFEYTGDDAAFTVVSSDPSDGSTKQNVTEITVTFSKNVLSDGSDDAADNKNNYGLVEIGENDVFDTLGCGLGVQADDTRIVVDSAIYNGGGEVTLGINDGVALPDGTYRLFACGSTSIHDLIGLELNGGLSDSEIDFTTSFLMFLPFIR